jgi:hypothetical protein
MVLAIFFKNDNKFRDREGVRYAHLIRNKGIQTLHKSIANILEISTVEFLGVYQHRYGIDCAVVVSFGDLGAAVT